MDFSDPSLDPNPDAIPDEEHERKKEQVDQEGWFDWIYPVGDAVGSTSRSSGIEGAVSADATPSVLDAAIGAEIAQAAGSATDIGAGLVETITSVSSVGVDIAGDVAGGAVETVFEVIGGVLGALSD